MIDYLLVVICVLLAGAFGGAVKYYRQLQKVGKEYQKAKGIIGDIVMSFNRQLKREAEKLAVIEYKVEASYSRSKESSKGARPLSVEVGKRLQYLEDRLSIVTGDQRKLSGTIDEIGEKLRVTMSTKEDLVERVSRMEEQVRRYSIVPEQKMQGVIPIRREKALAPLTETEMSVLTVLASDGRKTAPQITDRIKLSREHTARLMKRLYEAGYLDRFTHKIPFEYQIKREMEKLLKKTESDAR